MKFSVFTQNPVNVNVVYFPHPTHSPTLDDEIDVNVKYVTPFRITVENDFVFYYAIDENQIGWRTVDITYLANKKVLLTLISQDLRIAHRDVESAIVRGDLHISSNNADERTLNNLGISSFVRNERNKLQPIIYNITNSWERVCILQFTESLSRNASVSPRITENYICQDLAIYPNKASTQTCDVDAMIQGSTGVFSYVIKEQDLFAEDGWTTISDFLSEFVGDAELNKIFINARFIKIPREYLETSTFRFGVIEKIVDTEQIPVFVMGQIVNFNSLEFVIDGMPVFYDGETLSGTRFWRIGEHIIDPKIDEERDYTLKLMVILGVGTVFGVFYTGTYRDIMSFPQNCVVTELGYNITPNTINPSLYYTNKQYQSLVDARAPMTAITGMLGTLASIFLMPKATALTKIAIGVAGTSGAFSSMINAETQAERERANHTTIKNTNDVQDLCSYIGNSELVVQESYSDSIGVIVEKGILDGYTPHYVESKVIKDEMYRYNKFSWMEFEPNKQVYSDGFFIGNIDTINNLLFECNV